MQIRLVTINDARALSDFYQANHDHLTRWEPLRPDDYHTLTAWQLRLEQWQREQEQQQAAYFIGLSENKRDIIATCSLTNIIKGPFQAGNLGYGIAKKHQGKGLMKKLCQQTIDYAFNELKLNRIMANYLPDNHRSAGLLQNLGFEKEGYAQKYLKINGQWQDHVLTALINPSNH
ncbi:alanine acetyltransferase [Thalassotalea insulae]|uniref:Alanine acetyltransferase n=1 Tax=Thalassotalea insulae TaxID=2056778 RepID=A0ABQ6GRI1_9GAMM|nr:GNAT family N-acetyltransferase [Thalassotalea insulae]GLX78563.1 alanine acetyltransferase [Thalassotalea insulae]